MIIPIKILSNDAILPTRGSEKAAGYDLYACIGVEDYIIQPKETVKIGTGIAVSIPDNFLGGIFARSGLATKQGLRPANCVGIIDSDYTGELIVALHNDSDEPRVIHNHDRIAQLVIIPFLPVEFSKVDELEETDRGAGGFGSTGGFQEPLPDVSTDYKNPEYQQLNLFDEEYTDGGNYNVDASLLKNAGLDI